MAFVPAPGVCEVFLEHSFNGKPGVGWVLHYRAAAEQFDQITMSDLGEQLRAWWAAEIADAVVPSLSLQRIRMRNLTSQNSYVLDYATGLPVSGTGTGSNPSANVAFSLKKNTGFSGKSFRGRVYVMGMSENVITGNFIDASWANQLAAAFNEAIILVGTVDTYAMALVSKFAGKAPRVTALVNNVISFTYEDLRVDTQRRRL